MIDTSLVPFAYGFLVLAAVALALAVAGIAIVLRDLRRPVGTVVGTVGGSSEHRLGHAA